MEHQLEIQNLNGIQVIDSRIIAKGLNINHKSLMETIREYKKDLEDLGTLPFETAVSKHSTGAFKKSLVVAFVQARNEVALLQEVINESVDVLEKKRLYYKKQGYNDSWIEERLKNIEVRQELEAIWCKRGVSTPKQYAVLTSIISKGVFDLTPKEHSELKGLNKQPLRNHMTRLELIFMTLAEGATAEFTEARDAQTYQDMKDCAKDGGDFAGQSRLQLEAQTGRKVVSTLNFLPENRHLYQIPTATA
jgi:hypothetical protein